MLTATTTNNHQTTQQQCQVGQTPEETLALLKLATMLCFNSQAETEIDADYKEKKSQNVTLSVEVESSDAVAEIVGRQGSKIKGIRNRYSVYIKTPIKNEPPIFVLTGRNDDVIAARNEILSAAEHFKQIRSQRKNNINGVTRQPGNQTANQVTLKVAVPLKYVGLVVGPKGATIKRIQSSTSTYILTPSRESPPVFEVTGLPENVDSARKEIEAHIALRTGGLIDSSARYF